MKGNVFETIPEISETHKRLLFGQPLKLKKSSLADIVIAKALAEKEKEVNSNNTIDSHGTSDKYKLTTFDSLRNLWREKLIIPHDNKYLSIWDMMLMFMIIYSTLSSAYLLAFDIETDDHPALNHWNTTVEIIFAIDLVLTFFKEYQDIENFCYVRNHWMIAKRYLRTWFFVDFFSVFPFESIFNIRAFRLLRILRLPRLLKSMDGSTFDKIIVNFLPIGDRQRRIKYLFATKYVYKIMRLLLIAAGLTYFVGCFWYFVISTYDFHDGEKSFYWKNHFEQQPLGKRLISCCYFALTTLSTVGYGDLTPQSNVERMFGIAIMITGIALFSYIMGNFNEVLSNYDKQMGLVNKDADLQMWIRSLSKFAPSGALSGELVKRIHEHFQFVWKNDRLSSIGPDDPFLNQMPKSLQQNLIGFLFDDIFTRFRSFLHTEKFKGSPFYLELAFELLPRKYEVNEFILRQGSHVQEIYLINEGSVFIYFEYEGREIGKLFEKGYFFGNYNVFSNVPSEFNIKIRKRNQRGGQITKVFAIPKSKLLKILEDYPAISSRMTEFSKRNANSLRDIMRKQLKLDLTERNGGKEPLNSEVEEIFKNCISSRVDRSKSLFKEITRDIKRSELLPTVGSLKMNPTTAEQVITQSSATLLTPLPILTPGKVKDELSNELKKAIIQDITEINNKMQIYKEKLLVRNKKHINSNFYY